VRAEDAPPGVVLPRGAMDEQAGPPQECNLG